MMATAEAKRVVRRAAEPVRATPQPTAEQQVSAHVVALPKMLSVRTVARMLDRDRRWVFSQCRGGAWPGARMVGNAWRIPEAAVLLWLNAQEGPDCTDSHRSAPESASPTSTRAPAPR